MEKVTVATDAYDCVRAHFESKPWAFLHRWLVVTLWKWNEGDGF